VDSVGPTGVSPPRRLLNGQLVCDFENQTGNRESEEEQGAPLSLGEEEDHFPHCGKE
jgi:hypothetical protein